MNIQCNFRLNGIKGVNFLSDRNRLRTSLCVHVAIVLTAMLSHDFTLDGMLNGIMIPNQTYSWTNLSSSDNFRAIKLSSILRKLLVIILIQGEDMLYE